MSQTYSFLDHDDIVSSLKLYLRNQEEFKDFNFEGSAISELLRVLAFNAQQQAFYNNFVYNELQLDSAQLEENVNSLASRIGYTASSKNAAKIKVALTVTPSDITNVPSSISLTRDAAFYVSNDGATYTFAPDVIYNASLSDGSYVFPEVTLLQGTWMNNSYVVETTYGYESYEIPNKDIDTNTLEVYVRTSETSGDMTPYTVFKTAYDLSDDSQICFLRKNRNGFYEIRFGDGKLSKKLDFGNIITIKYMTTKGSEGNGLTKLSLATSVGGFYNVKIDNLVDYSYGGSDEESIESIRNLAPLTFSASGNAVTTGDYVALVKKLFPEAESAISWNGMENDPPKPGYVVLAIKPKTTEVLNTTQKNEVIALLNKYNVASISPVIVDPEYIYVNVTSKVKYDPALQYLTTSGLQSKISDYIKKYSVSELEKFGGSLDISRFSEYINAIDASIKGNVTIIQYERRFTPILNFSGSYTVKFYHQIKPGTLYATGFRVTDTEYDGYSYQMHDDGNGNIVLSKSSGSLVSIIQSSVGSVDYDTGVVSFSKFNPNFIENTYVKVTCESGVIDQSIDGVYNTILKIGEVTVNLESTK